MDFVFRRELNTFLLDCISRRLFQNEKIPLGIRRLDFLEVENSFVDNNLYLDTPL